MLCAAQGVFTADEDAKLLELYAELGPRWKEIGGRMGRLDRSVRDRAKVLNYGRERVTGQLQWCTGSSDSWFLLCTEGGRLRRW